MRMNNDPLIFERFQGVLIGVMAVTNADNSSPTPEHLRRAIDREAERIREEFVPETISQQPGIHNWREAYHLFGGKPKENRSSVEALYRFIMAGKDLRSINTIVDAYNYISLAHMLPVGGEDLDKVKGDITLTFASPSEPPVMLLGDKEARTPHPGEVIYKDDVSAVCRRWNWREAERTKLTEETKNCVLVIEGLPPVTREDITKALLELEGLVMDLCKAETRVEVLDESVREIELMHP